jgi:ribulose kinase
MPFTLGIDYGTNSVRALVVDVSDGRELATALPPTARRIRRHYQVRDLSGVMKELIHIKEEQTR